jgi:exosortase/archaeosortase family protein
MSRQKKRKRQPNPPASAREGFRAWYEGKAPLLRFGIRFLALIALFYALTSTAMYQRLLSSAVIADARLSSAVLNLIGEPSHVNNSTIASARYALTVLPACSAVEYPWFLCAAMLAFPCRPLLKLPGVIAGTVLLLGLNVVRVVSLYWIGVHWPSVFDIVHEQFWTVLLTAATVLICIAWIRWATEDPRLDAAA